jgi:photosystem II stability/assembly factor-like uncharacterized protein
MIATAHVPFITFAIDFVDPLHGFVAGGQYEKYEGRPAQGLLATNDGGRTWTVRYESGNSVAGNPITRVQFTDVNDGWAAIGGCTMGQNGPCGGSVMLTRDGGRTWQAAPRDATQLVPVSATEAWVLGTLFGSGVLWHSTDGGVTWQALVRPGVVPINALIGSENGLAAITPAGVWSATDRAQTWEPFDPPMFRSMSPLNPSSPTLVVQLPTLVILVDGVTLHVSHDAGHTATTVTLPSEDPLSYQAQVAFADGHNGIAVVGSQECFKSGQPPNPLSPTARGEAAVLVSSDGGLTWKQRSALAANVTALSAAAGLAVIVDSSGCNRPQPSIEISLDNGLHWIAQGLPSSCSSVSVAAPSTIWLTCQTDRTMLLMSQDGARTWTQFNSPPGVAFVATAPSEGWAYGPSGALWHTTDAGGHWTSWLPSF